MRITPITSAASPSVDHRPAVTVLSGFSPGAVQAAARALLIADDNLVAVGHDLTGIRIGRIRRAVETGARVLLERTDIEMAHGCVSCALREDVLPTLVRLARERPRSDQLLILPPAVEPEAVAAACAHCLVDGAPVTAAIRFDSFVTVIDADSFLDDLTSTDDLSDRDLHAAGDDHRAVAEVVAHQVEFSDTVLLWNRPDSTGTHRAAVVAHRLAPWSIPVTVDGTDVLDCTALAAAVLRTGRHDPDRPGVLGMALEGRPIGVQEKGSSLVFRSRRPFHPDRLHDALEELTENALRGRGQLWIASQPDAVIAFEFAGGGVSLGCLGYWLAALPPERWTETSDHRRLAADLNWDPYYGDRGTALALIGLHLDHDAILALLRSCLLTDAELADGSDVWRRMPDPFAGCFPLTDDDQRETQ